MPVCKQDRETQRMNKLHLLFHATHNDLMRITKMAISTAAKGCYVCTEDVPG